MKTVAFAILVFLSTQAQASAPSELAALAPTTFIGYDQGGRSCMVHFNQGEDGSVTVALESRRLALFQVNAQNTLKKYKAKNGIIRAISGTNDSKEQKYLRVLVRDGRIAYVEVSTVVKKFGFYFDVDGTLQSCAAQ